MSDQPRRVRFREIRVGGLFRRIDHGLGEVCVKLSPTSYRDASGRRQWTNTNILVIEMDGETAMDSMDAALESARQLLQSKIGESRRAKLLAVADIGRVVTELGGDIGDRVLAAVAEMDDDGGERASEELAVVALESARLAVNVSMLLELLKSANGSRKIREIGETIREMSASVEGGKFGEIREVRQPEIRESSSNETEGIGNHRTTGVYSGEDEIRPYGGTAGE